MRDLPNSRRVCRRGNDTYFVGFAISSSAVSRNDRIMSPRSTKKKCLRACKTLWAHFWHRAHHSVQELFYISLYPFLCNSDSCDLLRMSSNQLQQRFSACWAVPEITICKGNDLIMDLMMHQQIVGRTKPKYSRPKKGLWQNYQIQSPALGTEEGLCSIQKWLIKSLNQSQ